MSEDDPGKRFPESLYGLEMIMENGLGNKESFERYIKKQIVVNIKYAESNPEYEQDVLYYSALLENPYDWSRHCRRVANERLALAGTYELRGRNVMEAKMISEFDGWEQTGRQIDTDSLARI